MRRARVFVALAVLLALGLGAPPARADLGRDVEALTLAWSAFGRVTHLAPRLLERGDVLPLELPVAPLDPKTPDCATLAVLGVSSMQFLLDAGARTRASSADWPDGSLAGALRGHALWRDEGRLGRTSRSRCAPPRGVLEFLVLESDEPPPPLTVVLPERDAGTLPQPSSSGPRPLVAPVAVRVHALEERAAREQAIELTTVQLVAGGGGTGASLLTLTPGCHRFALLAEETERRGADVDLEISKADGNEVLAADHGESSDGGALLCVAVPTTINVRFGGVAAFAKLALVRARWDLDRALPARWPNDVRARMSGLLRGQRRALEGAPLVDEALGVQGDTLATLRVEPGACYLALAVGVRGDVAGLSLAAQTKRTTAQSRLDADVPGAALTFCAGAEAHALLEVDARGLGLVWMSAVWQIAPLSARRGASMIRRRAPGLVIGLALALGACAGPAEGATQRSTGAFRQD